jgi:hypothetical protein
METNKTINNKNTKIYKIVIGILTIIIIILVWLLFNIKGKVNTVIVEKNEAVNYSIDLKGELDALLLEHEMIKEEYGNLSGLLTDKDSLIMEQAKEIEKLINSQADYRRIKKQLDYLRTITQGYVNQIDSLYTINQELVHENTEIKQTLQSEKQRSIDLEQEKVGLEEQISSAAYLKAYNVNVNTISLSGGGKEKDTDKGRRINVIKVCFTLGENSLIPAGTKDIFMRIARPDNIIITQGSYSFVYQGERIQYTEKVSVKYNKNSQNVCIKYNVTDNIELNPGIYHINLFADDVEIGQKSFELK